jgi:hypothetical protein
VADAARDAFVEGWQVSMWVGVGLAAAVFVYLLARGPRDASAPAPAPTDGVPASVEIETTLEPVLVAD